VLRQGLPDDWSIRPLSLSAGVGLSEGGKVEGNLHIPRSMGAHIS
jgi:hypothetical protein